jgi:hypothetical protein
LTWSPVSPPRPAVLQSRRAQELPRLAVAPTRHSVSLYGALIGTSAQCHVVESGVKNKVRSKLYYDEKCLFTNGMFGIDRTVATATANQQTAK